MLPRKPTTGIAFCCAPAKSGYAAAPARTVMKFRRLIPSPAIRRWAWIMALQSHFRKAGRMATFHPQRKSKLRRYPWVAAVDDPHTQSGAVGDMAHGPVLAPVGPQAPPRRPLRLRVDTRYADGGAPPMDLPG